MNKCADRSLSWVPFHSKWIPFFARSRRCPIIVLFSIFLSKSYLSRTFSRTNRSLVEIVLIIVLSKSYFSRTFSRTNRTFLDLLVEIPLDFLVVPILLDFCRPDLTRLLSTRSYSTFVTPILLDVLLPQSYSMFCCPNPTRCFVAPVLLVFLLPQSYSTFVVPILLNFCCPNPTQFLCCPNPTRLFCANPTRLTSMFSCRARLRPPHVRIASHRREHSQDRNARHLQRRVLRNNEPHCPLDLDAREPRGGPRGVCARGERRVRGRLRRQGHVCRMQYHQLQEQGRAGSCGMYRQLAGGHLYCVGGVWLI